jgi:GGDEF domain-containing protein
MRVFDQVEPSSLDRRELQLWILALTVILVLAVGVALLMYPTAYSPAANPAGSPLRAIFLGFCGLSALVVGYFIDRQVVIHHLRAELENEKRQVAQIRQEASADLLTTLPGFNIFRDRLAMEHRRASNTQQPLSLLAVELKPSRELNGPGEIETAFGDAAKALMHKLGGEDSIFLFAPGIFGIVLPAVAAIDAYSMRDRLIEGLHDAAEASYRFAFSVSVVNFPEHVTTAREMEESVRRLLPRKNSEDSNMALVTPALGIQ